MYSNSVIPNSHVNQSNIYNIMEKRGKSISCFHANLPNTMENWILYKFTNFAAVQDVHS